MSGLYSDYWCKKEVRNGSLKENFINVAAFRLVDFISLSVGLVNAV